MNPRFHLALQSGSNPMLRRMNRKYTLEQFLERIATFKSHNPSWAITTDLIVGFPGETEEDFQQTVDVCKTGIFSQAFMFVYSPRRGTPAAVWHAANAVPKDVAQDRFVRLKAVQDEAVRAYHDRKVGTTVRALIHGVSRKDATKLSAKTVDNVTVNFPLTESAPDPVAPVGRRARRERVGVGRARNVHRPRGELRRRRRAGGGAGDRPARGVATSWARRHAIPVAPTTWPL